jgi:hypothetical protein
MAVSDAPDEERYFGEALRDHCWRLAVLDRAATGLIQSCETTLRQYTGEEVVLIAYLWVPCDPKARRVMAYIIKIVEDASGEWPEAAGTWFSHFDAAACEGRGRLFTVRERAKATRFPDQAAAATVWVEHPPLQQVTMTIMPEEPDPEGEATLERLAARLRKRRSG